jgi:hypothetical protein
VQGVGFRVKGFRVWNVGFEVKDTPSAVPLPHP